MQLTLDDENTKALLTEILIDLLHNEKALFKEILLEVLGEVNFVKQTERETMIPVKKLDPFLHSVPIECSTTEDLTHVKPFAHVEDSARFGKKLREEAWERK